MLYDGWAKYIQNFALKSKEIKIAKLEIANKALLILCMEFYFCGGPNTFIWSAMNVKL